MTGVFHWVNFAVLAIALGFIFWKYLGAHFKKQREDLESMMKQAGDRFEKLQSEKKNLQAQLEGLSKKFEEMAAASKEDIRLEIERMQKDSAQFVQKLSADTEARIHSEIEKGKRQIQQELVQAASDLARDELTKDLSSKDSQWTGQIIQSEAQNLKRKNYGS